MTQLNDWIRAIVGESSIRCRRNIVRESLRARKVALPYRLLDVPSTIPRARWSCVAGAVSIWYEVT